MVHVRVGLQEMVGGVVAGTDRPADQDAATYWRDHRPPDRGDDDVDAILWTRRTSSAYRRPRHALEHLRMAADTVRAAVAAAAPGRVAFQGHVLDTGDFLTTWAVELAVHHLDLGGDPRFGSPTAGSLRLGRATVEALAGAPLPAEWSDEVCLLAGSGRTPPRTSRRGPPDPGRGRCSGEVAARPAESGRRVGRAPQERREVDGVAGHRRDRRADGLRRLVEVREVRRR
ncbi:maleylpyruvate isomerase N-terminal domain-containing protein [Pseudonocardia petroleophila]